VHQPLPVSLTASEPACAVAKYAAVSKTPAAAVPATPLDAEPEALSLPAADLAEVVAGIAAAPVLRWHRALVSWAGTGRAVGEFARILPADMAGLPAQLGLDDAAQDDRDLLVDIAVRWSVEASLLRLRTGLLRPAQRHVPLLDDPAALWFRMLSALYRPDMAFTDLLGEYSGYRYAGFSPGRDAAALTLAVAKARGMDEAQLAAWCAQRWSLHRTDAQAAGGAVRVLTLLASALGILTRDGDGRWAATGLGRVYAALTRLPREELDDDNYDEDSLIGIPGDQQEPGFVLKVGLTRYGVWRRLRLPGQLTAYGLHTVIQAAFGWDGDHLHVLRTGPFTFAPSWPVLDQAIPSELITLTDLAALGVRELTYTYDLGDCWDHQIIVERILPPADTVRPQCLAGRGTTPAEDGVDWHEDNDGNPVPTAGPEPSRIYDLPRINRTLTAATSEPDETADQHDR
jgi:hypothetical protein